MLNNKDLQNEINIKEVLNRLSEKDFNDWDWFESLDFNTKNERLEKLINEEIFITNSPYDIVNLLKNKPKEYRILYDKNIDMYMIGDANYITHWDLAKQAYNNGYYNIQDEHKFFNYYDSKNFVNLIFTPNKSWKLGTDNYRRYYEYDFGCILDRPQYDTKNIKSSFKDTSLYDILGEPLDIKQISMWEKSLNERLEKVELKYGNDIIDTVVSFSPSSYELQGLLNKYKALRVMLAKEPGKSESELVCIPAAVGDHGLLAKWLMSQGYMVSLDTFYHIVQGISKPYLTLDSYYIDDKEELKNQLLEELKSVTKEDNQEQLNNLIDSVKQLFEKLPPNVDYEAVEYAISGLV